MHEDTCADSDEESDTLLDESFSSYRLDSHTHTPAPCERSCIEVVPESTIEVHGPKMSKRKFKHGMDLLTRYAREDQEIDAASERADAQDDESSRSKRLRAATTSEVANNDRLRRALDRTGGYHIDPVGRFHFFDYDESSERQESPASSGRSAKSDPGRISMNDYQKLFPSTDYKRDFKNGIVYTAVTQMDEALSNAMFFWLVVQISKENDEDLVNAYIKVIRATIRMEFKEGRKRLNISRVRRMFLLIHARPEVIDTNCGMLAEDMIDPAATTANYFDEMRVVYFLKLLAVVPIHMHPKTITYTVGVLMRLGCDNLVAYHQNCFESFQTAMSAMLVLVPLDQWGDFCEVVSEGFQSGIAYPCHRAQGLDSLPVETNLMRDFRRRMAAGVLFRDSTKANFSPSGLTMQNVFAELDELLQSLGRPADFFSVPALLCYVEVIIDDWFFDEGEDPDLPRARYRVDNIFAVLETHLNLQIDRMQRRLDETVVKLKGIGPVDDETILSVQDDIHTFVNRMRYSVRVRRRSKSDLFALLPDLLEDEVIYGEREAEGWED